MKRSQGEGEDKITIGRGVQGAPPAQDRAWLWILGLAIAIPMAVFFAFQAASRAAITEPAAMAVTVTVILLGAAAAYFLYRAGVRAAARRTRHEAAVVSAELVMRISAERDRLAGLVDHMPAGCIEADPDGRLT